MDKYVLRQAPLTVVIGSVLAGGSVTAHANTITVNSTADAPVGTLPGACTLRSAVASANSASSLDSCAAGSVDADEIVFAPGLAHSTITLSEGQMEITGAVTISGPVPDDPSGMTIDGDETSRIFRIEGGEPGEFEIALHALTLTGGYQSGTESGGAVSATDANLILDHVVVMNSRSNYGGGLGVSRGNVMLSSSTISQNSAVGYISEGGGLDVRFGDVVLSNSTVSQNSAVGYGDAAVGAGGGLSVRGGVVLNNSTVSKNSALGTDDSASGFGGGLNVSGNVTLSQSTISYNTADGTDIIDGTDGIRLFGSSSLTLYNSLVVQADADQTACNQAADEHGNTLVTDTSCTGTATTPALIALNPLADNGGPTQTHALNAGSTAIDAAGDCVAQFGITEDQRDAPRPVDGDGSGKAGCDIGAYELQDELFHDRFERL